MELLLAIVIGLILGSFYTACIYRVPRKISLVSPSRSMCPSCEVSLPIYRNIPVVTWVFQLGKCANCRAPISIRYPIVEATSAALAVMSVYQFGLTPTGILIYAFFSALLVLSVIDLDFKIIPDVISFPGMIIGLLVGVIAEFYPIFSWPITTGAFNSLIGFLVGGGFFYVIAYGYYLFTKQIGIGGGDIKLMAMIGALLGWEAILPTVFVGSIVGAVIGIAVMLFTGSGRRTEIPFGPWLSLGALIYVFGEVLPSPIQEFFTFGLSQL